MSSITVTTRPCMSCNETTDVDLTQDEVDALNSGAMVQNALSGRDADFRELFVSGTHGACWDAMFG